MPVSKHPRFLLQAAGVGVGHTHDPTPEPHTIAAAMVTQKIPVVAKGITAELRAMPHQ